MVKKYKAHNKLNRIQLKLVSLSHCYFPLFICPLKFIMQSATAEVLVCEHECQCFLEVNVNAQFELAEFILLLLSP